MSESLPALKALDDIEYGLEKISKRLQDVISDAVRYQDSIGNTKGTKEAIKMASQMKDTEDKLVKAMERTMSKRDEYNSKMGAKALDGSIGKKNGQPDSSMSGKQPLSSDAEQSEAQVAPSPKWNVWKVADTFQEDDGIKRYSAEIEALKSQLTDVSSFQKQLSMQDVSFLPEGASDDITLMVNRLGGLEQLVTDISTKKKKIEDADPSKLEGLNMSFENVRSSLQEALNYQNELNKAIQEGDPSAVQDSYSKLNKVIQNTEKQIRNNTKEQKKFTDEAGRSQKAMKKLVEMVGSVAKKYLSFTQIKDFFSSSVTVARKQIDAEKSLQTSMSRVNGMTQEGINLARQRAYELEDTTPVSSSVGMQGQAQLAKYVHDPSSVAALTDSMYDFAVATHGANISQEQLVQTADLMGKVLSGDLDALANSGFNVNAFFSEAEQQLFATGTEAQRTALLIQAIEEHMSGAAEMMGNMPDGQITRLNSAWESMQVQIGTAVMPLIEQFLSTLLTYMPAIEELFTTVLGSIVFLLTEFANIGIGIAAFFTDNWSVIEPIIWGIVTALSVFLGITQAAAIQMAISNAMAATGAAILGVKTVIVTGLTTAWRILNTVMKGNVLILIISLIVGIIAAIARLLHTNDKFKIGFYQVWYGILDFMSHVNIVLYSFFEDMYSVAARNLNKIIKILNLVPGVNIDFQFDEESSYLSKMKQMHQQGIEDRRIKLESMKEEAARKAAEAEIEEEDPLKKYNGNIEHLLDTGNFDPNELETKEIGECEGFNENNAKFDVGTVDRIKNTVEVSSEDLKMMRELAEMKNIQNFVSLTPSISFGDTHVRNEGDLDTIIARITNKLQQDITSSADAAYG